ncbi:ABC transporter substrate-binding protein [Sphingosinicella sp. BN140058]|uniref:ABC transporter substrate-binding protein n=1 Tax=Sphingosinicella sp. BN140058 TaxID=1892855 RepID=UPI0010125C9F|nr:extracellular solute-binding protein [Sphingosinicella sp. BN140058]QAY78532.1 extracellular solute-binding protein [Sphingosinicella sp. BN140058]
MMRRTLSALALAAALAGCSREEGEGRGEGRPDIYVQRFFGECGALYGRTIQIGSAEGECGIVTALFNRFGAQNRDIGLDVNVVAWPGYAQLAAQMAAGDPPDLVTMHQGVISDYQSRGLLEPMDSILREAGIRPEDFTDAARRGVTKNGIVYGLPWDTVGGLYHVNTKLFAAAGLMNGGKPVIPGSAAELLDQARRFKEATGKPYFVQSQVNDPATHVRNLYSFLLAQDANFYPDGHHIRLRTPEAKRVVELFRTLEREGLTTRNQDNPAAIASFINGDGGVFLTGTWMIGPFEQEAEAKGRPLSGAYAVVPYPRLWGHAAAFVDGHAWVMPKRKRSPEQHRALVRLFRFMAAHNFDWARTGHIPAFKAVVESPAFAALPHRGDIAPLARIGAPLPAYVRRQGAIEGLVGEEIAAAVAGTKPVDQALADAERRVNELLTNAD